MNISISLKNANIILTLLKTHKNFIWTGKLSFKDFVDLTFPYSRKVSISKTLILFKKCKEHEEDMKYKDMLLISEKYDHNSAFLTSYLDIYSSYLNEIRTGFNTFSEFLESTKKY